MLFNKTVMQVYRPTAAIRVTGEDAFGFLQGQFTNELRQGADSATYGLWLNQKGKILADSHVLRLGEAEFLLFSATSSATVIQKRLEEYIVADDVTLEDNTPSIQALRLGGEESGAAVATLLGAKPDAGRWIRREGLWVFHGRHVPGENYELLGSAAEIAEIRRRLAGCGIVDAEPAAVEFARISAGIPAVPVDLGPGDLPNEGGLENSALSYTKGCYLGQEVMARLKNLGKVRRRLHVVRGPEPAPVSLAPLYQGAGKVGEIRSVAAQADGFVALAMISLINFHPETGLGLAPAGPAVISADRHG